MKCYCILAFLFLFLNTSESLKRNRISKSDLLTDVEGENEKEVGSQRLVRDLSEVEKETLAEEEEEDEEEDDEITTTTKIPPPILNSSKIEIKEPKNSDNIQSLIPSNFQIPQNLKIPPQNEESKNGEILLPPGYNNLEIPKLNIGKAYGINLLSPVPVIVYLHIRSIRDFDELKEQITLEIDLVVEWIDGVLFDVTKVKVGKAPTQKTLNPIFLKKIWSPDIYMDDLISVSSPKLMANKPLALKFSPETGFISYTSRVALALNCDMLFHYYPADTQTCEFRVKSYSFKSTDLDLSWFRYGVYLQDPKEPNFDIAVKSVGVQKEIQPFNNPKNETTDTLVFTILARRKLSYHMVQTYLPSIFFIVITWLGFLIPARFVEVRIGISMTTLLTLTSMFSSVRESTPIVSYVKAIDIWMVFCIFFVFATLLEFSFLIWVRAMREEEEERKNEILEGRSKGIDGVSRSSKQSTARLHGFISELIEKYAFIIFSIIFILFTLIYWTWLIESAKYNDWVVNATYNSIEDD